MKLILKLLLNIKITFYKWLCNVMIFADGSGDYIDRINAFFKSMLALAPIAFALGTLEDWYLKNMRFTMFAVLFVLVNSIIGAIVHFKNSRFNWENLLLKTVKMMGIISAVYFVLEGIISPVGNNVVTEGFKATFKVATLLYPGAKILKNIFIWTGGEHPPKWIMQKVYNFQENGDLNAFLESKDSDKNTNDFND